MKPVKFGYDIGKKKAKPNDRSIELMERRLREAISKHRGSILCRSVDIVESRRQFHMQLLERVYFLDGGTSNKQKDETKKLVVRGKDKRRAEDRICST